MEELQLLKIIKSVLNSISCNIEITDWKPLIALAMKHGVLQYLSIYVNMLPESGKPDEKVLSFCKKHCCRLLLRVYSRPMQLVEIQGAFESNHIFNIALKGANTKKRYPDELLRTMGALIFCIKRSHRLRFM